MAEISQELEISKSTEFLDSQTRKIENFLTDLRKDLEEEIERIVEEEKLIGEGRAARVFNLEMKRTKYPSCIKIWRPELKLKSLEEYKKVQYLTPKEEFELQDNLYLEGFREIPRPIAYGRFRNHDILAMEQIRGYTFKEIAEKKGSSSRYSSRQYYAENRTTPKRKLRISRPTLFNRFWTIKKNISNPSN